MDDSTSPISEQAKRRPSLVITIPFEDRGHVVLIADSYEDEIRLKTWLGRSGVLHRLVDELDVAA